MRRWGWRFDSNRFGSQSDLVLFLTHIFHLRDSRSHRPWSVHVTFTFTFASHRIASHLLTSALLDGNLFSSVQGKKPYLSAETSTPESDTPPLCSTATLCATPLAFLKKTTSPVSSTHLQLLKFFHKLTIKFSSEIM